MHYHASSQAVLSEAHICGLVVNEHLIKLDNHHAADRHLEYLHESATRDINC